MVKVKQKNEKEKLSKAPSSRRVGKPAEKQTPLHEKNELIETSAIHKGDTGSIEVQVALLTKRVGELTEHLKIHKKDFSSRRGLLGLVNKRRKLLMYLLRKDEKRYQSITKKLGLTK